MIKLPFEISDSRTEVISNWHDAILHCSLMGEGWRLPLLAELRILYGSDKFGHKYYWASDNNGYDCAWALNMGNGNQHYDVKGLANFYVRAIRNN